jgi:propanol-preferring alcohol dehydrogenase
MANTLSIPSLQTALWVNKPGPEAKLELRKDVPVPTVKSNEILVKIQYSGLWYTQLIPPHKTWTT